jgi:serine protease Do
MKKIIAIAISASLALALNIKTDNSTFQRTAPNQGVVLSYAPIVKQVTPSVVNISTTKVVKTDISKYLKNPLLNNPLFNQFLGSIPKKRIEKALGSGVIISKDGYIITNNHVVSNATKIVVFTHDGKKYKAKLIGTDPKTDLAVIKIDAKNLKPITFTDSSNIEVGDIALAIGNPFGIGETVTEGIISGLNRNKVGINAYENFIQTDAAINPGNSGGALVDLKGRLIGINSAILTSSGGNNGVGFAIPSNMVKFVATSLIENGKVVRGFLGVEISNIDTSKKSLYGIDYGVLINKVMPKSAAKAAGLKAGDIIVAVDGKKVKDAAALRNKIAFLGANAKITLKVFRNNQFITLHAKLKPMKTTFAQIKLLKGVTLAQQGQKVFIAKVEPKSISALLGLKKGDLITAIRTINTKGWIKVHSISEIEKLLKGLHQGDALLQLKRGDELMIVQI